MYNRFPIGHIKENGIQGSIRHHRLAHKLHWQVLDAPQVKCVEKLEGVQKILQLHLPIHTLENPRPTNHS